MLQNKLLSFLLLLLLAFFYLLFSAAVPATRNLMLSKEHLAQEQGAVEWRQINEEVFEEGEGSVEARMALESNDYPGTGANNHHDPKTPGRPY